MLFADDADHNKDNDGVGMNAMEPACNDGNATLEISYNIS